MKNVLGIVQLMNPGNEQIPDEGTLKRWHTGRPGRRFMKIPGYAIAGLQAFTGEIDLWGEWEPESEVVEVVAQPLPDGPRYIYHPYYVLPGMESVVKPQSTDSFIFGKEFLYISNRQYKQKGPTYLRYLAQGSVILFCSYLHAAIHLDTVFVVSHWIDFTISNFIEQLHGKVSDTFFAVSLLPWYQQNIVENTTGDAVGSDPSEEKSFRLYFGATHDNPVDGMFSFFPCQPYTAGMKGFERPEVRLDFITNRYIKGSVRMILPGKSLIAGYWSQVKQQVLDKGLMLGVLTELPECRGGRMRDEKRVKGDRSQ